MLVLPIRMKEVYLSNQSRLCKNASTQGWHNFNKRSKNLALLEELNSFLYPQGLAIHAKAL